MLVQITFNYVRSQWTIYYWKTEVVGSKPIHSEGSTLVEAYRNLNDTELESQIKLWFKIG